MLPWVDRLWRYDKTPRDAIRLLLGFRRAHYDAVVDLIDNPSVTSSLIVRGAGSRYAIGILKENASVYSHCVPLLDRSRVHIVERIAQLLLPFGIDPAAEPLDLAYPVTEAEAIAARSRLRPSAKTLRFGINISGSSPTKEWGMDNFVSFLRWLEQCYPELDPTVCGAPDQAAQVEAIVAATGAGSVGPLTSFHEFAAVVHEFDLLLTPDTSIVHLAAAWKTPTVALYHQWNPDVMPWYPYRTRHRALCDRDAVGRIPLAAVQEAFASLMTECFPTLPAQDRRRPSGP
jgi:ADP-heptose:LPS heptosyltransferase